MTILYPEQLKKKILNKFYNHYVLFGNDEFLLNYTQNILLKHIQSLYNYQYFKFLINNKSIWKIIFQTCQTNHLFEHKKKFSY